MKAIPLSPTNKDYSKPSALSSGFYIFFLILNLAILVFLAFSILTKFANFTTQVPIFFNNAIKSYEIYNGKLVLILPILSLTLFLIQLIPIRKLFIDQESLAKLLSSLCFVANLFLFIFTLFILKTI